MDGWNIVDGKRWNQLGRKERKVKPPNDYHGRPPEETAASYNFLILVHYRLYIRGFISKGTSQSLQTPAVKEQVGVEQLYAAG